MRHPIRGTEDHAEARWRMYGSDETAAETNIGREQIRRQTTGSRNDDSTSSGNRPLSLVCQDTGDGWRCPVLANAARLGARTGHPQPSPEKDSRDKGKGARGIVCQADKNTTLD